MFRRMNTFAKITTIIGMLLVPMIALYSYSNHVSTRVVEEQLIESTFNRMTMLLKQMDDVTEQIWRSAYTTMQDENATRMQSERIQALSYESINTRARIEHLMRQQINALPWEVELTLFVPSTSAMVTTTSGTQYDMDYFLEHYSPVWSYRTLDRPGMQEPHFVRHITKPFTLETDAEQLGLILEAAIPVRKLADMLQQLQSGTSGEPILYRAGEEPIVRPQADASRTESFIAELRETELASEGHSIVHIGQAPYLMNYSLSESFGWHLVDFIPLETIMQPIRYNTMLFYLTTGLLLMVALASAALVYRNVQIPIRQLTRGVQRLARGEYAYRMKENKSDEFSFLFEQFNAMSAEIKRLIENVYFEQINVREAKLKQLQSQINPHFLYNNFNFIQSMTQMGNKEAVVAITQHLSHYYRYTTRTGEGFSDLREEVALVRSYLEIHKLQMGRLTYEIDIPDALLARRLPRLLLQPLVENAVVHGIENRLGQGAIRIFGEAQQGELLIRVEDNGVGMSEEQLRALPGRLDEHASEHADRGLWNVHQRLKHAFDSRSGLAFERLPTGGLSVTIRMIGGE